MRQITIAMAAALTFVWAANQAQAVLVKNLTTGEILFDSGSFSNETPGQQPSNPTVGEWSGTTTLTPVTDATSPGAYHGANYLRTERSAAGAPSPQANFAKEPAVGETIRIEFMLWSDWGDHGPLIGHPDGGTLRARVRIASSGAAMYFTGSAWAALPDLTEAFERQTWQHWVIEYTRTEDNPTFSWSIDDVTVSGIPLSNPGDGGISFVSFAHTGLGVYYIDSVPEPAGAALLASGGVLMLLRRRHTTA